MNETTNNTAPARFGSGQAVRRMEDDSLLAGTGRFTDDVRLDAQVQPTVQQSHLVFVRSPYPHARLASVDTSAALGMPGVLSVTTGEALVAAGVKPLAPATFKRADGAPCATPARRALAHERVRFVGEAVAAVVAETLQQARDAAEAVVVDYEELPMAVNVHDATAPGAPALCPEAPDNVAAEMRHGNADATVKAFDAAHHTVRLSITNQRVAALTLEPRSVLAYIDTADGRLNIRMSTQMPSGVRNSVCDALGLPREKVRVTVGDVGGGFGMKTGAYPEDLAVAWCAHQLGRPVKWVADRSEEFLSSSHGRDLDTEAEMALDETGRILALRLRSLANVGAYATGTGVAIQLMIGPWGADQRL